MHAIQLPLMAALDHVPALQPTQTGNCPPDIIPAPQGEHEKLRPEAVDPAAQGLQMMALVVVAGILITFPMEHICDCEVHDPLLSMTKPC